MSDTGLTYVGKGSFVPGVPARDLTEDEVTKYGGEPHLLASGIYVKPRKEKLRKSAETKESE